MRFGILSLGDNLADPQTGLKLDLPARYRQIIEIATLAESLGLDGFYLGEHHFCDYAVSSPAVLLAAIAEHTERLRLGTGVALIAHHDAVRIAEDYATLDVVAGGRLDLVVGRGLLRRTYSDFGQDADESRAIFAEKLDLLRQLWSGGVVSWKGEYRDSLDDVQLVPQPVQAPHPPIWIAGGSSFASVDTAVAGGYGLILPALVPPPSAFRPLVNRYRERFDASPDGANPGQVAACSHVHVAPTTQAALRRWRPYHMNYFSWLMETLMPWGAMNVGTGRSDFAVPEFDDLVAGPSICGSPAEVVDRIGSMTELLGLDMHLAMLDHGGIPHALVEESMTLLATDVIPQLTTS